MAAYANDKATVGHRITDFVRVGGTNVVIGTVLLDSAAYDRQDDGSQWIAVHWTCGPVDWLVLDRTVIQLDCDGVLRQIAGVLDPSAIASIKHAYEAQHTLAATFKHVTSHGPYSAADRPLVRHLEVAHVADLKMIATVINTLRSAVHNAIASCVELVQAGWCWSSGFRCASQDWTAC